MRKISFALCIIMLLSCFSFSAFAVEDTETIRWDDEVSMTQSSGYPRMAQRADGTLILTTDGGVGFLSNDKGHTWTKLAKRIVANASTSATYTKDGTEYTFNTVTRANFQPFVMEDGTVLLGYRFHTPTGSSYTEGDPFYTSIRVMTSNDGGLTYDNEVILVEDVAMSSNGFWEPFFLQIDENTIACYYADDLNVYKTAQQRIAFVTYDIPTGTWDTTPKVAIYRGGENGMSTRDGMPMATTLSDGSFAMVTEVQDFASWMKVNTKTGFEGLLSPAYTDSTFVVGLSLSDDGINWDAPTPVFGPLDLTAGDFCAAPSIATLPDGRIIITCQTEDGYTGSYGSSDTYKRVMGVAISDAPITKDTVLTAIDPTSPKADGAATGFTRLTDVFNYGENVYSIWNAAFNCGNDIYLFGTSGTNAEDGSRSGSNIRIRHLQAFATADEMANYDDAALRAGDSVFLASYGVAEDGKVTLGVPAGVTDSAYVYRMEGGKFLVKMDADIVDGKLVFEDNGGYYAVSGKELVVYGDATADSAITLLDVIRVIRYISGDTTDVDVAASDVNCDLDVNVSDVLSILKMLVSN